MGATNSTDEKKKYYALKAKASENETPAFVLTEKVQGKWAETGRFDTMIGMINSAKIVEKSSEKAGKFNVFTFIFDDGEEVSQVEFTHNSITHSFINSLASDINTLNNYKIQVFKTLKKGSDQLMHWNGGIAIRVNGIDDTLKWFIDPKQAPQREKVMKADGSPYISGGKQVYDDTKVKEFWENFFKENIIAKIGTVNRPKTANAVPLPTSEPVIENTNYQDDIDSLPF